MDAAVSMQRSISMPAQPLLAEAKLLKRSQERERINEENADDILNYIDDDDDDDYGSDCRGRKISLPARSRTKKIEALLRPTQSGNDFTPYSWAGSTIELNADGMRRNEIDPLTAKERTARVIEKSGRENVSIKRMSDHSWRFIRDFVTTLIDLKWKYMLCVVVGTYFFSWFFYAALNYMVSYYHGDLHFDAVTGARLNDGREECVRGVYDFVSMLVYSIETQTTIGFGEKYPTEECAETHFLFILQIICSIALEGGIVCVLYAKTSRPAKQITKLKFSEKAVICYRDGELCLQFRVCDLRQQQTIESRIRVYVIVDVPTREGELIKTHTELRLQGNGQQLIVWPEIVCHVIDASSPLWRYKSARDLVSAQFELYVSIVGVSPATAQVTEARTSYIPREIYWGQRFVNVISYDYQMGRYVIDHRNFNTTISVDMQQVVEPLRPVLQS